MDFKTKQYDGPYEVIEIEINNGGELIKGLLYLPPQQFSKPYPVVIYFHDFPQLLPLVDIVKEYQYLLEKGYALIIVNFRGYNLSEGEISITSQVSDGLKLVEFAKLLTSKNFFRSNNINFLAKGFGSFIALIVCSKVQIINIVILITPILNISELVNNPRFTETIAYIKKFFPTRIHGIRDINNFIDFTKQEIQNPAYQIEKCIIKLKCQEVFIISGLDNKLCPSSYLLSLDKLYPLKIRYKFIKDMDHEPFQEKDLKFIHTNIEEILTNAL